MDTIFPSLSSILSISVLGAAFGLLLSIAKLKLNVEKDPRFVRVLEALPGANCGSCGHPGCAGYASKIVEGAVSITLCPVGNQETVNRIAEVMGVEAEAHIPLQAMVHCHGGIDVTKMSFVYDGPRTCEAAHQIMGGFKICSFGCLGLGDCGRACPFNAISMNDRGLPVVDWDRCTGCGHCVRACPRSIISLENEKFNILVMCRNMEKAPVMKKGCSVGCTACMRCVKACKEVFADHPSIETAIEVSNFLAVIDYNKCINCGKCAEVCPQKVIEFNKVAVGAG